MSNKTRLCLDQGNVSSHVETHESICMIPTAVLQQAFCIRVANRCRLPALDGINTSPKPRLSNDWEVKRRLPAEPELSNMEKGLKQAAHVAPGVQKWVRIEARKRSLIMHSEAWEFIPAGMGIQTRQVYVAPWFTKPT